MPDRPFNMRRVFSVRWCGADVRLFRGPLEGAQAGQGMWPAFWLLGHNGSTGVNEIDIHEILGQQPSTRVH